MTSKTSWSLKRFAEGVVVRVADAIAEAAGAKRIEQVDVGMSLEDEPAVRAIHLTSKDGDEQHPCRVELELAAGHLKKFVNRHAMSDSDQLDLGDSELPPLSVLVYELNEACRGLPVLLRQRNVAMDEGFVVKLDGCEVEQIAAEREATVRRGVAYAFVDNLAAREFAMLCYKDPDRRAWLESLANPLIHYTLV